MSTTATPRPQVMPFAGQMMPRVAHICSVHFMACRRRFVHDRIRYHGVKAIPVGKAYEDESAYDVLSLYDTQEWIHDLTECAGAGEEIVEPSMRGAPIMVEGIVRDLIHEWTTGFIGELATRRPGIMQIAGAIPTREEFDHLMEMEKAFCRAAINEATTIHITRNGTIQPIHRGALEWMKLDKSRGYDWYPKIERADVKRSAASGNDIPMTAMMDGAVDLIDLYVRRNLNPLTYGDTFLAGHPEYLKAAGKPVPELPDAPLTGSVEPTIDERQVELEALAPTTFIGTVPLKGNKK